ncbi:MAG: InlB B-repeat-containing protein [Oscillospiraceae bacterium]
MYLGKKLISLNLVLVLILALAVAIPATGAAYEEHAVPDEVADAVEYTASTVPTVPIRNCAEEASTEEVLEKISPVDPVPAEGAPVEESPAGVGDGLDMSVCADSPYNITVGNTTFYNTADASGTGWSYSAEEGVLTLNEYQGGSIKSYGDLKIYSYGTVKVTGSNVAASPSAGVTVAGELDLYILSGNAYFTGASGSQNGADGINAKTVFIIGDDDTVINCTGGYSSNHGGHGISGDIIYLIPDTMYITGGGSTGTVGVGIHFTTYLYIGVCSMVVQAGGTAGYAIASPDGLYFYYSKHVTLIESGTYKISVQINRYNLVLYGNGGTYSDGRTAKLLNGSYPTYFKLWDYVFTRDGYQQIGWVTGSDLIPLKTSFCPGENTSLYASWAPKLDNAALFIGNGGTINGSYYLNIPTGASVSIPGAVCTVDSENLYLLGWSDLYDFDSEADSVNHIINGSDKWYLPGTTVSMGSQTTLYAHWIYENSKHNIVYYNGNGGKSSMGGAAVVQAALATASDITLYVQDDMAFTRDGYVFDGWTDDSGAEYETGQAITNTTGAFKVTNLYAQWLEVHSYTAGNGASGDSAALDVYPTRNEVKVSLDIGSLKNPDTGSTTLPVYYALYENGRMIAIEMQEVPQTPSGMTGSVTIDYTDGVRPDACRIFVFGGDDYAPAYEPLTCDLS